MEIGENGFREILGYRVLTNCDFKGRQWKDIAEYLGKPNFTSFKGTETEHRYRLNYFSHDVKHPGTLLLDITVNKEGTISSFVIWDVDG